MKSLITYIIESRQRTDKEQKRNTEGISLLDKVLNGEELEQDKENREAFEQFIKPNGPTIYAFITDKVKNAIKIGYTDQHPLKRIEQWKKIYGDKEGEVDCLGYWSAEEFNKAGERVFFWDHPVHNKVEKKGYANVKREEFYNSFLSDKGKAANAIKELHYSKEFFNKYKQLLQGELEPEEREELSEKLIEDIVIQMREAIKRGDEDFKTFKLSKEGKATSEKGSITWKSPDTYSNTNLQEEAIKNGIKAIKDGKKNILMAAVMRFGKTHAAYEIIKEAKLKRVIVTSGKADVREAWRVDINHKDFYKDFLFVEIDNEFNMTLSGLKNPNDESLSTWEIKVYDNTNIFEMYKDKTIIVFATLHDLGGSIKALKKKHAKIFENEFDIMVVDETHYGSHGNLWGNVTKSNKNIISDDEVIEDTEEEMKEIEKDKKDISKLDVKFKTKLQVSGTPYYILASNEMIEKDAEIISKVSYTDMMKARDKWYEDNPNKAKSESPYFGIPTLHKIGLHLTKECRDAIKRSKETDSLTALFELSGDKLKYEKAIKGLMKGIFGDGSNDTLALLKSKKVEGNKICKHTIIVLPRIKACDAVKSLLETIIDTNERQIIKLVGDHPDIKDIKDLNNKLLELDDNGKKSIILTVNKFLTGVSMPLVDSMIFLKNSKSPQEYDQNIFRLCTRNVRKVQNAEDNEPKLVNMKDNVYLIDFNIDNMFNMLANSARMKAAAEDDPRPERVKELMEEDVEAIPIFCEGQGEIMGKMHEIKSKDLMKVYAGYNENKSISDICNDEINLFDKLFGMKDFQRVIAEYDIEGDASKINIDVNDEGEDEITTADEKKPKKTTKTFKEFNDTIKITKEKFKAIVKVLLYCNLCLDNPYTDIEKLIKDSESNKELKNALEDFKLDEKKVKKIYDVMSNSYKQALNNLLLKISLIVDDMKNYSKGTEKYLKALSGLGRLGKSEVVTPEELVNKMIDKLDESEYKKADSILLVNEKQGEFLYGLIQKFGKDIAKKCKIVPSSTIGKNLTKKLLKSIGINDYINKIIIDLEDENEDGQIDVKDFLKMQDEDILELNSNKKFDIVLMNPPYGSTGNDSIHLKFVEKCLNLCKKQVVVMPFVFVTKTSKVFVKYKEKFNDTLLSVEEIDSRIFETTAMPNVGIYNFDINKQTENIEIKKINGNSETFKSLLDISEYNKYESNIIKYLEKHSMQLMTWGGGHSHCTKQSLAKQGITDEAKIKQLIEEDIKKNCNKIPKDKVYLTCNSFNGGMNAKFFSSKNGEIFDTYEDLVNMFIIRKISNGYNIMIFNSKKEAENCKEALQHPLLRFTCYKNQNDQAMSINRVYKYIPDIDWSNDKVKTDEGLLELCGCPKDKCKEYADYCKNVIDKVDKKS